MRIAEEFNLSGKVIKDTDVYHLIDNTHLKNLVVSTTSLHPGKTTRGHSHEDQEEVYIFLSGSGFMYLDEHQMPVKKGDVITIESGVFHRVTNPSQTQDLYFLCVFEGSRDH